MKSTADIKELRSFMVQVGVASVFAGITFDNNQHRSTFNSDQSRANITIENLKLIDHSTDKETSWQEIFATQIFPISSENRYLFHI